jgi:hypothetical protein
MPVESYQRRWRTGLRVWGRGRRDIQALKRFSLECTVSTDHLQATTEAGWHEPVHWYANRSSVEASVMLLGGTVRRTPAIDACRGERQLAGACEER